MKAEVGSWKTEKNLRGEGLRSLKECIASISDD
jgi:hypothetical protein